jgi:hypothetical protein
MSGAIFKNAIFAIFNFRKSIEALKDTLAWMGASHSSAMTENSSHIAAPHGICQFSEPHLGPT